MGRNVGKITDKFNCARMLQKCADKARSENSEIQSVTFGGN